MVQHAAHRAHGRGDGGDTGRILDALDGGQRRHLHAGRGHDHVGTLGVQAFHVVQQLQRIATAHLQVVGDLEADGIDDLDAFVLDVLHHQVGQRPHVGAMIDTRLAPMIFSPSTSAPAEVITGARHWLARATAVSSCSVWRW